MSGPAKRKCGSVLLNPLHTTTPGPREHAPTNDALVFQTSCRRRIGVSRGISSSATVSGTGCGVVVLGACVCGTSGGRGVAPKLNSVTGLPPDSNENGDGRLTGYAAGDRSNAYEPERAPSSRGANVNGAVEGGSASVSEKSNPGNGSTSAMLSVTVGEPWTSATVPAGSGENVRDAAS